MTAQHPDLAPDWRPRLALIGLAAFAIFAFCLMDQQMFADGDTNWHVATGRWILAHCRVPTTDPFSHTAYGHRWVAHEWLSEVLMALAWQAAQWSGVMLLIASAAAVTMGLLATELSRRLGVLSVIAAVSLSFTVLLGHILARPHMIALPFLVIWLTQLLSARRAGRTPSLWLLPLVVVWANLHGSFIFGLAFTGPFALEAVLDARARAMALRPAETASGPMTPVDRAGAALAREWWAIRHGGVGLTAIKWGAFLVAATGCSLITPNGVDDLFYGVYVMSMPHLRSINEWKAMNFQSVSSFEFALFFALFICLFRGVRVGAVRLGLILLLLFMTLQHLRQEIILSVAAPLLLADPLRRALEPGWPEERSSSSWPVLSAWVAPAAVIATLFLGMAVWRVATPERRGDGDVVPYTALAHVPASLRAKPVFNNYSFGGWLVFQGVRPFMDGRSDMYGDALLKLYLDCEAADQAAIKTAFKRYDVQWTILAPSSALAKWLDTAPGWHRLYADKWAVVHVRDDALPQAAPKR